MDLGALAKNLREQAAKSAITIDATLFPAAVLADIRTAFLLPAEANLTITGVRGADIPEPENGVLKISAGTAAVLHQTGVGIALTFAAPAGALTAVITATMSPAWKFTDSFAALDEAPFSALQVSDARFAFATVEQPAFAWPGEPAKTIPLAAGMNFLSHVTFAKFARVIELVGRFIGVEPLKWHGPFGPKAGEILPVGALTAQLKAGTFEIGSAPNALSLGEPAVVVSVGTSDELNPVQVVELAVQGVFNRALNIAIEIPMSEGEGLSVSASPLPSADSVRALVEKLPGGSGFMGFLPGPLADAFARVGLDGFTMVLAPAPTVTYLHLAIGTRGSWTLIPDVLKLEQLQLHLETLEPSGVNLKRVAVRAQAAFFERIFPGVFEFTIELQKQAAWEIGTITGAYYGRANLGAIVGEVLRNPSLVPAALRAISFSDFGVTVTRHGADAPATYALYGSVETAFPLLGRKLSAHLNLAIEKTQAESRASLTGGLVIGEQVFALALDLGAEGSKLHASWKNNGAPFGFATIAQAFGWDSMPALPENLDLGLKSAEFFYDFTEGTLAFSAESANYGNVFFATRVEPPSSPRANQRTFVFTLDVPLNVDLTALPVIGERLPSAVRLGIQNLEVNVASAELKAADVTALREIYKAMLPAGRSIPIIPKTLVAGVTFGAQLEMGGSTQAVVVPLTGKSETAPKRALLAVDAGGAGHEHALAVHAPAAPASGVKYQAGAKWFDVQKSFGPVHFERIGLQYQDGALFFLLDASLTFSALSFSLEGLGVGSPLKKFAPHPHLDGLAVSFHSGPVAIEGGLRVVPKDPAKPAIDYQYIGAVTIAVEPYLIAGVASYAKVSGSPSFFMFAQVKGAFGGPPCFFITGFMGGFGYNSQLTLPPPEKVYEFPFVAGLDNPAIFGGNPTPMGALQVLAGDPKAGRPAVVTPASGEMWLAGGVMFRSFELVFGRALIVAQFGREFQVSLLGVAKASLPQGATSNAYAYIELQLQAVFKPDEGVFSVIASLTPASFVITKDCRLSGGFAFCMWFGSNPRAGDFVISVGGYHPAFAVPAWYPRVAPVGFNWKPNGNVTVKGGAYFALTPSAIMAGGALEVLFQSGAIRAWFTAYANLLITWKPFHFNAGIGVSLGAAVEVDMLFTTVTLSFEVGATLELWGPPTGGVVHVHLYIVSFSVSFGSSEGGATPPPLGWKDFKTLLPQDTAPHAAPRAMLGALEANNLAANAAEPAVLRVHVNRGLTRQDAAGRWFVRADELIFTTETAVPATAVTFGTDGKAKAPPLAAGAKAVTPPATINIRPMALTGVTSTHNISLTSLDRSGAPIELTAWTQVPQARNLPEAMWGSKLTPKPGADATPSASSATVPNLPVGTRLIAPPAKLGATPGAMNIDTLIDRLGAGWQPLKPATQADPIAAPVADPANIGKIASTLASPAAQAAQKNLVAALKRFGAEPPTSAALTRLAQQAGATYSQPPLRAV